MPIVTQDDYHQRSDALFSIWECKNVDRRGSKGNKERWYFRFCGNEYNIWNPTKALMHPTRPGGHRIALCRGEIIPKYQRHLKALKERKEVLRNQRVSKRYLL